ncbi:NAD(P)H-hydrate dehydratase [Thermophagus sp. OGC60D27]|uniref:NAD(P)H-hydrate dehydratase n=1 Tax=Thermophagus sp. OGC60D27 TaxID=3458415 RepID=UPI004037A083
MKILTSSQTGEVDRFTIENEPIASVDLMERAATQAYRWISDHYPSASFSIFAGPGNNGGDALAIARMLLQEGRKTEVFLYRSENLSPDATINLERLRKLPSAKITDLSKQPFPGTISSTMVAIDGLFGSGLNRILNERAAEIVSHINQNYSQRIAIDVPSGLFCEDNSQNNRDRIVRATYTLTFQMPKLAFLFPENREQVGQWIVLPIGLNPRKIRATSTPWRLTREDEIRQWIVRPHRFAHKGTMGHALLIAGSYGKTGAAQMASKACLKSGVGLLTAHVPNCAVAAMQTALPETMINPDRSDIIISEYPDLSAFSAIGVGPGLGTKVNTQKALRQLIMEAHDKKMILDADALNILAANKEWLNDLPPQSVLTPHPKEFERLAGPSPNDFHRLQQGMKFAQTYNVVLVLKGAYTAVIAPQGEVAFNPTGNPGMATAGSGDALTGVILALLANGIEPVNAARAGVYVHGLAGDLAAQNGQRGTIVSDIIEKLGPAFALTTEM